MSLPTAFHAVARWLRAGWVTRFHTHRQAREQDVAQHSWGVAVLICYLWGNCRPQLLKAALMHDMGESIVGDLPAPAKWHWKELHKHLNAAESEASDMLLLPSLGLTDEECQQLRWCDMLEALLYSWQQRRLGNIEYVAPFRALTEVLSSELGLDPRIKEIVEAAENDMKSLGNYFLDADMEQHFP